MGIYELKREQAIQLESGLAYLTIDLPERDRMHVLMWQPKAKKPFFNYLVKYESVEKEIEAANKRLIEHKAMIADRREKAKPTKEKMADIKIGDIFYTSWGYDQTNIDFYQVTTIKNAMVGLTAIGSTMIQQDSWASGKVMPVKDSFKGEEFFKKASFCTGRISFTMSSYSTAWAWDGKAKECSWWA